MIVRSEDHTTKIFTFKPYEFISKNDLSFFQGNVVKYVCRYKNKNGVQDLEKIIHYCELEIKKMKDEIKVEKDFLPQDDFNKLKNKVLRSNFFYHSSVAGVGAHDDGYYFTHTLFANFKIRSDYLI